MSADAILDVNLSRWKFVLRSQSVLVLELFFCIMRKKYCTETALSVHTSEAKTVSKFLVFFLWYCIVLILFY